MHEILENLVDRVKANPFKYALVTLIVILGFMFVVLPSYRGYTAYAVLEDSGIPKKYISNLSGLYEMQQACDEELTTVKNQQSSCRSLLDTCTNVTLNQQTECNAKQAELNGQISSLNLDLSGVQANLSSAHAQVAQMTTVVADAARRICCVKRVDDPTISGYSVANGRIECVSGAGMNLSC